MTGPGGDEVARVSVKVVPNTDDFKRDLERQLQSIRDAEIQIPVKLDIDKADLERQLQDLRDENIRIPVSFDVESVQDDINRATRGARASAVRVPVEADRDSLDDSLASIRRDLGPIEVPLDVDDRAFSTVLREALARGRVSARDPILFTLDADASDVQRKITQTEVDIERLRSQGVEIMFRARSQELQTAITQSEARLNDLTSREWTADVAVKILGEQDKIAKLRAELGALDQSAFEPAVRVKINEALGDLARFSAEMGKIDRKRATAVVDLDVNTAGARADIEAFLARQRHRHSLGIDLEVDTDTLGRLSASIGRSLTSIIPDINGTTGAFSGLISSAKEFTSGLQNGLGPLQGSLGTILTTALQIGGALLYASAVGTGLAFAGAAITAAWGGISTIIGTLPGVLGLVAAAGGTVALGLDGIKKAASTIKPEFDKLKTSVAATFEQGMTPAFKQLATIFPKLQDNINGVAKAISVTATNMVILLTSSQGVEQLQGIFDKTKVAILGMQPGLRDIVETFLTLANQKAVFDLLRDAVNDFGAAFKTAVTDSIASRDFEGAIRGLSGTLRELSQGFTDLVKNGISLFSEAAPGLNHVIDQITGFFNRFDWNTLGRAVGDVFRGLGDAIKQIPQGVIDNITNGFQGFATAVNSPTFQAGFQAVIDLMGQFVAALPLMLNAISRAAVAVSGFVDIMRGLATMAGGVGKVLVGAFTMNAGLIADGMADMNRGISEGAPLIAQGMAKIAEAAREGGPRIVAGVQAGIAPVGPAARDAIIAALQPAVQSVETELNKGGPAATKSLRNMDLAIEAGVKNWEATAQAGAAAVPPVISQELGQVPPAANAALAPLQQLEALKGMRDQFTLAAADSMHAMSVGVQSGMAEVQNAFKTGMDTASSGLSGSFTLIEQGVISGMKGISQQVDLGMTGVQTSFTTGFGNIATGIGTAIAPIRSNIGIAMAGLTQEVANGMITVTQAFQSGFTGIASGIGTTIAPIRANIGIAMGGLTQEVANGMIQVTLAFQTGFATIAFSVGAAIAPIRANVGIAMGGLTQEVTNGMLLVTQAFTTGFGTIAIGVGAAIAPIRSNVAIAMGGLSQEVTNGFVGMRNAFTAGFSSISTVVGAAFAPVRFQIGVAMTGLGQEVTNGMISVRNAFQSGFAGVASGIGAAIAPIRANIGIAMNGLGQEVTNGMTTITNSFRDGFASIGSAIPGMMAGIKSGVTASMVGINQAVATGMVTAGGTLRAGVDSMVRTVSAASGPMRTAGALMMGGLRQGILSQAGSIAAAAAQVVSQAIAAARAAAQVRSPSRVFMEIGAYMGEGLALGMESAEGRVAAAADRMASAAVGAVDQMQAALSDSDWADSFSTRVEHSFADAASTTSTKDVVGQLRALNGNVDQSSHLTSIIALLQILVAQGTGSSGAALGAQSSRRAAELGAF
jgi:hypothetical protein